MMIATKIRALWARMSLLAVDDDGMSTVEYSTVSVYTPRDASECQLT
jgi:hypothetical protein